MVLQTYGVVPTISTPYLGSIIVFGGLKLRLALVALGARIPSAPQSNPLPIVRLPTIAASSESI